MNVTLVLLLLFFLIFFSLMFRNLFFFKKGKRKKDSIDPSMASFPFCQSKNVISGKKCLPSSSLQWTLLRA